MTNCIMEVVSGGLQTTVQDGGRPGYLAKGIPPCGAQDHYALRMGSLLVGNVPPPPPLSLGSPGDAGLECLLAGPTLRFSNDVVVAVTGGRFTPTVDGDPLPLWEAHQVPAGALFDVGQAKAGLRGYVAIGGGIDVLAYLGSRSTYLRGAVGGFHGRALKAGDTLPVGRDFDVRADRAGLRIVEERIPELVPPYAVRVVTGPQDYMFTPDSRALFFSTDWKLSPNSDRMGFRFEGPPLELFPRPAYLVRDAGAGLADIVDDVIPLGGIQIPGGIEPIVMGVEVPSSGGYAKIATTISSDLGVIGQMRPGERIRFVPVTLEEAIEAGTQQTAAVSPDSLSRANTNGGPR